MPGALLVAFGDHAGRGGVVWVVGGHCPERAGGPPHQTGLPEASFRKPVRPTGLADHSMIRGQFLGVG